MITIRKANDFALETVISSVGLQDMKGNVEYRKSKFFYTTMPISGEGIVILNTMTGLICHISDKEEVQAINTQNFDKLKEINPFLYEYLVMNWFLVPKKFDEFNMVDLIRNKASDTLPYTTYTTRMTHFVVVLTTDCNARCSYCYQGGCAHITMTPETAEKVAEFIIKHTADLPKDEPCHITWFGGEPTLALKQIMIICKKLDEAGRKYKSSMMSNGFLIDENTSKFLRKTAKLSRIQITLDGVGPKYDEVKDYVYGGWGAFNRVISAIEYLADQNISVSIRLNVSDTNYDDLVEVADFLYEFLDRKPYYLNQGSIAIYTHTLYEVEDKEKLAEMHLSQLRLNEYIFRKFKKYRFIISPYYNTTDGIRTQYCMSDNPRSIIINPNGDIGKCEHFVGSKLIGTIFDDSNLNIDYDNVIPWRDKQDYGDLCNNCEFYPTCVIANGCEGSETCCVERICNLHTQTMIKLNTLFNDHFVNVRNDEFFRDRYDDHSGYFNISDLTPTDKVASIDLSEIKQIDLGLEAPYFVLNSIVRYGNTYALIAAANISEPTYDIIRVDIVDGELSINPTTSEEESFVMCKLSEKLIDLTVLNKIIEANKEKE